jgi:hypothetical protein
MDPTGREEHIDAQDSFHVRRRGVFNEQDEVRRVDGTPHRIRRVRCGLIEQSGLEEPMNSGEIFAIETIGGLVVFTLIAVWYWAPRLSRFAPVNALTALLLLHAFRTAGLTIIVPEVGIDPNLPRSFAIPAAYGDLIAAILALIAIAALRNRIPLAALIVWIFSLEGMGDLLNALVQGWRIDLTSYQLGPTWFIFTLLVPALWVTHVMIVMILIRAHRRAGGLELPANVGRVAEHRDSPRE